MGSHRCSVQGHDVNLVHIGGATRIIVYSTPKSGLCDCEHHLLKQEGNLILDVVSLLLNLHLHSAHTYYDITFISIKYSMIATKSVSPL